MAGSVPGIPTPDVLENSVAAKAGKELGVSTESAKDQLTAKSRGIRGGIHYSPGPGDETRTAHQVNEDTAKASYSMAHEARKNQ